MKQFAYIQTKETDDALPGSWVIKYDSLEVTEEDISYPLDDEDLAKITKFYGVETKSDSHGFPLLIDRRNNNSTIIINRGFNISTYETLDELLENHLIDIM